MTAVSEWEFGSLQEWSVAFLKERRGARGRRFEAWSVAFVKERRGARGRRLEAHTVSCSYYGRWRGAHTVLVSTFLIVLNLI